jgi:propane monooxygenase reductase subunit
VTLFFGARRPPDLYFEPRIRELELAMPLNFIPALSEEWPDDWKGETGMVSDAVARRLPNLEGYDAYLCGPPPMIDATRPLLLARGVRERNIYFDAFSPTGGPV